MFRLKIYNYDPYRLPKQEGKVLLPHKYFLGVVQRHAVVVSIVAPVIQEVEADIEGSGVGDHIRVIWFTLFFCVYLKRLWTSSKH